MTEQEFLASEDPRAMLRYLEVGAPGSVPAATSARKFRLFACACARLLWPDGGKASDRATQLAEVIADGGEPSGGADVFSWHVLHPYAWNAARLVLEDGLKNDNQAVKAAALLREIVGNPFRPLTLDPAIPNWCEIVGLAAAAYRERGRKCNKCSGLGWYREGSEYYRTSERCEDCNGTGEFEDGALDPVRLMVLADALEEAGCVNEELLRHLRGWRRIGSGEWARWVSRDAPHVRGCAALDCVLGKE